MTDTARDPQLYGRLIVDALRGHDDRIAFISGDRQITYAQARAQTARYAVRLAEHGVGPAAGVAALSPNLPEVWLAQAAALTLGGSFTGLHLLGSLEDHITVCNDSGAVVLLVAEEFAEHGQAIADASPSVREVIILRPEPEDPDAEQAELRVGPITGDTVALLQYTGGTTGRPKGVRLTHEGLAHQVLSLSTAWGLPENPRYLAASPITHVALLPIVPTLLRGGTVILLRKFAPEAWFEVVEAHRANYAFTVPTMLYALLDASLSREYDVSSLERIAYGASPMSPSRLAEARARFGNRFLQIYGQSENGAVSTVLRHDEHTEEHLASCGRAVPGTLVRILDEQGEEVPVGVVGELCVRSPAVMTGYHNLPEETATTLRGGWLHSGDLARQDAAGFFYIVDRQKDLIVSGGFNVYPREVEDALGAHPAVAESAVIGVPDDKWGEAVHAVVVLRAEVAGEELIRHVKALKGAVNAPKTVEFVASLPVTAVGKVDKKALRAPFWSGQDRQVH